MFELIQFIYRLIDLYIIILLISAVLSWLLAFNVINPHNQVVRLIYQGVSALTEPVLRPIRRMLPAAGPFDFSPLILLIALWFVQSVVLPNIAKAVA